MAATTLILFAHPAYEKSHANRALIDGIAGLDGVTVHDLYEAYPDFHIDVEREKQLLEKHQRIVWQHPLYWYSSPALLKEWFDVVLQYGWAYGAGANALVGKTAHSVITTGGNEAAYSASGQNRYTIDEFLRPMEQTATLCGMHYEKPLIFYQALSWGADERRRAVLTYRDWLARI